MNVRPWLIVTCFAVTALTTLHQASAIAESDPMARYEPRIDTGVRFPGDQAIKEGTVRSQNPEKGAYIERCSWSFKNDVNKGFGLTQTCIRYTLENTK